MKQEQLLEELELLCEKLGITVRFENGDFKGGQCQVKEKQFIIIPKRLPLERQIQIFAQELSRFPMENVFILPAIRELLERYQPASNSTVPQQNDSPA